MAFLQTAGVAAQALTSAATTSTQTQENLNTVFTQVTETVKASKATTVEELLKETATLIVDKINALNVSDEEKSALKQQAQDVLAEISKQTTDTGKDDPEHQLLQALVTKINSFTESKSEVATTNPTDTVKETDVDKTAETAKDVKKELDVAKADEIINDVTKDASNQPDKVITAEAGRGEVDVQAQETKVSRKVYVPKDQYQGDNKGTGYLYYYSKEKAGNGAVEITENDAKSKGYTHALTENAIETKSETKAPQKAKESKPSSIETVGSPSKDTTKTQPKKAESITEPNVNAAGTQPAAKQAKAPAKQAHDTSKVLVFVSKDGKRFWYTKSRLERVSHGSDIQSMTEQEALNQGYTHSGDEPSFEELAAKGEITYVDGTTPDVQASSTGIGHSSNTGIGDPTSTTSSSLPSTGEHDAAYLPILGVLTLIPIGLLLKRRKDA